MQSSKKQPIRIAHDAELLSVATTFKLVTAMTDKATMVIARQAGFAIGIALLGAMIGAADSAEAFAPAFVISKVAAIVGVGAALILPPHSRE